MGGTTAKVGLIQDGRAVGAPRTAGRRPRRGRARRGVAAAATRCGRRSIDLVEIGAGGGSIAWIDAGGAAARRPAERGRRPGAGLLRPRRRRADHHRREPRARPARTRDYFLGGEMHARRRRGARARDRGAAAPTPLGLDVARGGDGIVEIANAAMVNALRLISVQRGYDPRDFVLVAFGGAGPVHANALAREAEIPTVLVPPSPGIFSATGLLTTDLKRDAAVHGDAPARRARRRRRSSAPSPSSRSGRPTSSSARASPATR